MKPVEIRKLSVDELKAKLSDSREELMKYRFQQVTGQLTDTSRIRMLRRDVSAHGNHPPRNNPNGCPGR